MLLNLQQGIEPRTDFESVFCQCNGRFKQARPSKPAMLLVCQLKHANGAGRSHRSATHHSVMEGHRFAVSAEKQVFISPCGCRFPPIKGFNHFTVVVHQKCTTANPATLRLDQGQHHLYRNSRVDGCTPGFEHLVACISGQRVSGCHGKPGGGPARLFGITR